jgi:hypothetical protein
MRLVHRFRLLPFLFLTICALSTFVGASSIALSPSSGKQGDSVVITVTGTGTSFSQGSSTVSVTPGSVGVVVAGTPTVTSATQLKFTLAINFNATVQSYTVKVTTGADQPTASFTVLASGHVQFSAFILNFGTQNLFTTGAAQQVTLTNNGSAALGISGITASNGFGVTDNCPSSLAMNASCTISVTFSPYYFGDQGGTVSVADDSPGSPHIVLVAGTGIGALVRPARPPRPAAVTVPASHPLFQVARLEAPFLIPLLSD